MDKLYSYIVMIFISLTVSGLTDNSLMNPQYKYYDWTEHMQPTEIRQTIAKLMAAAMDQSVDPCEDFYNYACGNYPLKKSKFQTATRINEITVANMLLSGNFVPENEAERKAHEYFKVCLLERPKNDELKNAMAFLDSVLALYWHGDTFDWIGAEGQMTLFNVSVLFTVFDTGGVGQIQFKESHHFSKLMASNWSITDYANYTFTELEFLNFDDYNAYQVAKKLSNYQEIFKTFYNSTDRDSSNEYTFPQLKESIPSADFRKYFSIVFGRNMNQSIVEMFSGNFAKSVSDLLVKEDSQNFFEFYRWNVANNLRSSLKWYLEDDENILANCYKSTYETLNSAVLSIFANSFYKRDVQQGVHNVINGIRAALRHLVLDNDLFDNATIAEALKKVEAIRTEVAFASYIWDVDKLVAEYENFEIEPSSFIMNHLNGSIHKLRQKLKFVNRNWMDMTKIWSRESALDVDAFAIRENRGIAFFPVGLFKAPIYNLNFPNFYNYAVLGSIIGHEFTHFFDPVGFTHDSEGKVRVWWNPNITDILTENEMCYREQYSKYKFKNKSIDGNITIYENISDNIGLALAYEAYKTWLRNHSPNVEDELEGFTELGIDKFQGFFISFAQFHCNNGHREHEMEITISDLDEGDVPEDLYHSPGQARILGVMSNSKEFVEAFHCSPHAKINSHKKCKYL